MFVNQVADALTMCLALELLLCLSYLSFARLSLQLDTTESSEKAVSVKRLARSEWLGAVGTAVEDVSLLVDVGGPAHCGQYHSVGRWSLTE